MVCTHLTEILSPSFVETIQKEYIMHHKYGVLVGFLMHQCSFFNSNDLLCMIFCLLNSTSKLKIKDKLVLDHARTEGRFNQWSTSTRPITTAPSHRSKQDTTQKKKKKGKIRQNHKYNFLLVLHYYSATISFPFGISPARASRPPRPRRPLSLLPRDLTPAAATRPWRGGTTTATAAAAAGACPWWWRARRGRSWPSPTARTSPPPTSAASPTPSPSSATPSSSPCDILLPIS